MIKRAETATLDGRLRRRFEEHHFTPFRRDQQQVTHQQKLAVAMAPLLPTLALALLLAYQLLSSDEFARSGIQGFYVPWLQIIGIGAFAFIASLLMTIIPSRQASSIPIAEALRYE